MKSCWRAGDIILLCIASSKTVAFCCEADAKKDLVKLAEAGFVRSLMLYGFTARSALAFLQKGHELKIFIQILSGIGHTLTHGEGCEDGADSESVDMAEQKQC